MSKVIFLDYDGVVNTPMWKQKEDDTYCCTYNFPGNDKVNNEQAVQWLSEFCLKYNYSIVVTSTWRFDKNYKECLINAGLRPGIEILGRTKEIRNKDDYWLDHGYEIDEYLKEHPEITDYLIIDDEDCFLKHQKKYFIKTRDDVGFMKKDFIKAEKIIKAK